MRNSSLSKVVLSALVATMAMSLVPSPAMAQSLAQKNPDYGIAPVDNKDPEQFLYVPLVSDKKEPAARNTSGSSAGADSARPRVILALGGGGMRGAAHVGVLKALEKAGIKIDGIAGTSMGSIVGGLYSAGLTTDELDKCFADGSLMKAFMPIPIVLRIAIAPILSAPRLIGFHPYDGLVFGGTFDKYLNKTLPENKKTIESLRVPYAAVAIDLCDGHVYGIKKGSLVDAMRASSAVPAMRKPIPIGDKLFVDGGVLANVPVPFARALGGDVVIAVQVDEHFDEEPRDAFRKAGSVTKRMVKLQLATLDSFHERDADVVIHPNVDGVGLISTKKSDARRAIDNGEKAATDAIPAIRAAIEAATGNSRLSSSGAQAM